MTGWRCGWAVGPAAVVGACNALQSHSTSNVCSITQKAVDGGAERPAGVRHRDARRVPPAPRPAVRVARGGAAHPPASSRPARSTCSRTSRSSCRPTASAPPRSSRRRCSTTRASRVTPGEAFDAPGFLRISYATSIEGARSAAPSGILEFMRSLERRDGRRGVIAPDPRRASLARARRASSARRIVRTDDASRTTYGTDALKRGHPADVVVLPGHDRRGRRRRARCAPSTGVPIVPRGGGTGYTGGSVPTHGGVVLSLERMNRILEIDEANLLAVVEPNVDHRRSAGRGREGRAVLSAGPGVAAAVGHRRQRRRVRRRAARVQVRHDEAVRARARGRPADRRDHRDRRQGREERRRLRPDAPAGRIRRHAGDHHARSSCGWCRSRRCRRRCARRSATSRTRSRPSATSSARASCRRRSS